MEQRLLSCLEFVSAPIRANCWGRRGKAEGPTGVRQKENRDRDGETEIRELVNQGTVGILVPGALRAHV